MPDYNFWNERWLTNQIGFHQSETNPALIEFASIFKEHKKVFVPLCGKSLDMLFLRSLGLEVIGVEFSEMAIVDFIQENHLKMQKKNNAYEGEGIKIYLGDLFKLTKNDLDGATICYDRASLVAFNFEERTRYANFLKSSVDTIFATLFDYGPDDNQGPPFSVDEKEVARLFHPTFSIKKLSSKDCPAREKLKARGIQNETETNWLLSH